MVAPNFTAISFAADDDPYDNGLGYQEKMQVLSDNFSTLATYNETIETDFTSLLNNETNGLKSRVAILEADGVPANVTIPAISTIYNLPNIQCLDVYTGEDSNGWELKTDLPYNNETVPTGVNVGQFATVALAVAGGGAVEDWFYNTTDTYFYKITDDTPASETASRIYRAGSRHLPRSIVPIVSGSGASARLILFDITQEGCPMWMEFIATAGGAIWNLLQANTQITGVAWTGQKLIVTRANTYGFAVIDFATDLCIPYWTSTSPYKVALSGGISARNTSTTTITIGTVADKLPIVSAVNGVSYYTAPNASNDANSGMPIPYIILDTPGAATLVTPDQSVYRSTDGAAMSGVVELMGELWSLNTTDSPDELLYFGKIESLSPTFATVSTLTNATTPKLSTDAFTKLWKANKNTLMLTHAEGVDLLLPNPNTIANSMIAKIGSDFNTGWMVKPLCAAICDTEIGDITGGNLLGAIPVPTSIDAGWTDNLDGTFTHTGTWSRIYFANPLGVVGGVLLAKLTIDVAGGGQVYGPSTSSGSTGGKTAVGTYEMLHKDANSTISLYCNGDLTVSAVEIHDIIPNRAISAPADSPVLFEVVGTLSRTAILAGGIADLSGFAIGNYLGRAYDSMLDIGTGDFHVMLAFNMTGAAGAQQSLYARGDTGAVGARQQIYINSSGYLYFWDNATGSFSIDSSMSGTGLHTVSKLRKDGIEYLIFDGKIAQSRANTANLTNATAVERVGIDYTTLNPATGCSIALLQSSVAAGSLAQVLKMHHDAVRMLESGTVTLASTITDAHYDERNGTTRLLDSDDNELILNGLHIESSRDLTASSSTDVGSVAAIANSGRATVTGGSTDVLFEVKSQNLRESAPIPDYIYTTFQYLGDSARTQFPDQTNEAEVSAFTGWEPVEVWEAGLLETEGAADDYTVEFDGFGHWVEAAVAPGVVDYLVKARRRIHR